ncbi:ameloblastin [Pseudorasbora parva]|uniref:ameloblastin n=1 Tax=Pseudorasbora parva TaxID=51549 RepID=UPI00351E9C17
MTQMRLIALLTCFLAGTSGVPISPKADLIESVPMGDMPQFQPEPPRVPSGLQPQLAALSNPWASQPNPSTGLGQIPAQFQYFPYPHHQQTQFFYYPILGPQSRNPTFSYGAPAFQHATSQQYPANAVPASRPLMAQNNHHKPNAHQMHPNQPQQQQVQQFLYMVPQIQQRMAGPYGGLSSEELQNMGRMGRFDMPAFGGNVFPLAGPQPILRPPNTQYHINTFPAPGMTFSTNTEVQPPSAVAVPPSRDAIPAAGGSHPNNGANKFAIMQERERVPCDHVQSAETNTGPLSSGHGTFISSVLPSVQPDPHYSDPNLVPTTSPTPEEALVPASPPLLSDTFKTNHDMYP